MTAADEASTWRRLWQDTTEVVGSRAEARWLCERACGLDGEEFLDGLDQQPTVRMVTHLEAMVARYRSGEPLAYVLGRWSFRHLDVMVDPRVLIPRPETELLVDVVLERLESHSQDCGSTRVVDLGTGSGVIGLAIAQETWPRGVEVVLTDASRHALDVARANLAGLGRAGSRVEIHEGSWFDAVPEAYRGAIDVVVSNPPYIASADPEVDASVLDHEPHGALFAGSSGFEDLDQIIIHARTWLRTSGWLILEIGYTQGPVVAETLRSQGYAQVEIRRDLAGRDRIAVAQWVS